MFDDFRFALRRLRHSPGFTAVAVLTLALAIGANTAIFSVADAVLFRPLPYDEPDRIFVLRTLDPRTGERTSGLPYEYVRAIQEHHDGVEAVGLRGPTTMMHHATEGGAEYMESFALSPDYLRALGVRPYRGRVFTDDDASRAGRTVMVTYESWQRRLGGDEAIVGSTVRLGAAERDVVGILPPGFLFPSQSLLRVHWRRGGVRSSARCGQAAASVQKKRTAGVPSGVGALSPLPFGLPVRPSDSSPARE